MTPDPAIEATRGLRHRRGIAAQSLYAAVGLGVACIRKIISFMENMRQDDPGRWILSDDHPRTTSRHSGQPASLPACQPACVREWTPALSVLLDRLQPIPYSDVSDVLLRVPLLKHGSPGNYGLPCPRVLNQ